MGLLRTVYFKLHMRDYSVSIYNFFYFYRWPSGSRSISPGVRRRSSGSVPSSHSSKSELSSVRRGSSTRVDWCSSYPRVRANSWVSGPPSQSYRPMRSILLMLMVSLCKLFIQLMLTKLTLVLLIEPVNFHFFMELMLIYIKCVNFQPIWVK